MFNNRHNQSIFLFFLASILLGSAVLSTPRAKEPDLTLKSESLGEEIGELLEEGRYSKAVPLAEALVANQKELFGPDDVETAHGLNVLGYLLIKSGQAGSAIPELSVSWVSPGGVPESRLSPCLISREPWSSPG